MSSKSSSDLRNLVAVQEQLLAAVSNLTDQGSQQLQRNQRTAESSGAQPGRQFDRTQQRDMVQQQLDHTQPQQRMLQRQAGLTQPRQQGVVQHQAAQQGMVQQRFGQMHPIRQGIVEQQLSQDVQGSHDRGSQGSLDSTPGTASRLSTLFNWNSRSNVGKKRKSKSCRKKLQTWSHTFVCLSNTAQEFLPDGQERAALQIAGLGEKKVTLSANADAHDVYSELSFQFPKLSNAGGVELLRVPEGGGKLLEIIASPDSGYTVSYLRAVVHHAKIYIRPLQQDLSLDPVEEEMVSEPPKEECLNCGDLISITGLRQHIVSCKKAKRNKLSVYDAESNENYEPPGYKKQETKDSDDEVFEIESPVHESPTHNLPVEDVTVEDDPVLQVALHLSKNENKIPPVLSSASSMTDVVITLQEGIDDENVFEMVVSRDRILTCAFRRMQKSSFHPAKTLIVVFAEEPGRDTGGLTREFFRLSKYAMASKYMESTGCFMHNALAYQDSAYHKMGVLAAMSLVHGGGNFNIFCHTVYNFLSGMKPSDLIASADEVPDVSSREILKQIECCKDADELRKIAMTHLDVITECGFNKPITKLELSDGVSIVQAVALHKVILSSLAELTQFREGLASLGVAKAIEKHPDALKSYYCLNSGKDLTADDIRKLFTIVKYSEKGSNDRVREEAVFMFFVDYLDDCEGISANTCEADHMTFSDSDDDDIFQASGGDETKVSLSKVLAFFTGGDAIPPLGFEKACTLSFNSSQPYPTASTCALELTLPSKYTDFDKFKRQMDTACTMHGGFGLI